MGRGSIALRILNFDIRWEWSALRTDCFIPGETAPLPQWSHRREKSVAPARNDPRFLGHPARSPVSDHVLHHNILNVWNVFIDFLRVLASQDVHVVAVDFSNSLLEVGLMDMV